MLDRGGHSVFVGVSFLDVSESQNYNKSKQTSAELLQDEFCKFCKSEIKIFLYLPRLEHEGLNLPTNKYLFRVPSPEVGSAP